MRTPRTVMYALALALGLSSCGLGLRVTQAPANSGLTASVEGPGRDVGVTDANGQTLAAATLAINPVAIATGVWTWATGLWQ